MGSLPQHAILLELIPHRLPIGCSSPSADQTWHHEGPPFRNCSAWPLWEAAPLSSPAPQTAGLVQDFCRGFPWAVPPSGCIHCCAVGSSMAACGGLLCVVPMGCWGQPAPPWASSGLQGDSALLLKHHLPSFCTGLDIFGAVLLIVFHSFPPAAAV